MALAEFHTKRVGLVWPQGPGAWAGKGGSHLRLVLRGHPLVLEGAVDADGAFVPEFHSEWLEFIEDLKFQQSLKPRTPGSTS